MAISQMDFWWSKCLLWDSSWPSELFYGNLREWGAKNAFGSGLFDSIIAEFKGSENAQFKEKDKKNFEVKKKETKLLVAVEAFPWKTL